MAECQAYAGHANCASALYVQCGVAQGLHDPQPVCGPPLGLVRSGCGGGTRDRSGGGGARGAVAPRPPASLTAPSDDAAGRGGGVRWYMGSACGQLHLCHGSAPAPQPGPGSGAPPRCTAVKRSSLAPSCFARAHRHSRARRSAERNSVGLPRRTSIWNATRAMARSEETYIPMSRKKERERHAVTHHAVHPFSTSSSSRAVLAVSSSYTTYM